MKRINANAKIKTVVHYTVSDSQKVKFTLLKSAIIMIPRKYKMDVVEMFSKRVFKIILHLLS